MQMRLSRAMTGVVLAGSLLGGQAAWAAPAEHFGFTEDFDGTSTFAAGEDHCVSYAGTLHEVRDGEYRLVAVDAGPRSTEFKVVGTVQGTVELTPTVAADGPSYSGSYREHIAGWLSDPDNDQFRVAQFHLIGRLTGSDGSTLELRNTIKVTVRPDGTTVVDREEQFCG
jgi:hypothetical protein